MDNILSTAAIIYIDQEKYLNKYDLHANKRELLRLSFKSRSHDIIFYSVI